MAATGSKSSTLRSSLRSTSRRREPTTHETLLLHPPRPVSSRFKVRGWRLEVELYRPSELARPTPTYNLQPATRNRAENQIGCGFAALCSLRLSLFGG